MNWTKANNVADKERDQLILDWRELKSQFNKIKPEEMAKRKEVVEKLFDSNVESGTENLDLGNNYTLKATKKLNYKLTKDNDKIVEVSKKLNPEISKRLFIWSASISKKEYEMLSDNDKLLVNELVTITSGAPELELIEPKE